MLLYQIIYQLSIAAEHLIEFIFCVLWKAVDFDLGKGNIYYLLYKMEIVFRFEIAFKI